MTHDDRKENFERELRQLISQGITAAEYIKLVADLAQKWKVSV